MDALFIELPPFQRLRGDYLNDEGFRLLQAELMRYPQIGAVIQGTGGLRKLRFIDEDRQKGKRGGIRVIYYWWGGGCQFWLFTMYDKDQQDDLSPSQRKILKHLLDQEVAARLSNET